LKCTRIREKSCNGSCFEIDQEMDAILLIIDIVYGVCRIVIKSVQQCTYFLLIALKWWNKGKYFTLNSLSNHFSPFENENYHRLVISLQANNLTSLFPYATGFEIDQEMDAILLIIDIVYRVCRIGLKSVQQCTYFLFFVNLLSVGVNYGQRTMQVCSSNYMFWKLVNSFKMMK
jgi:hypothetical protein